MFRIYRLIILVISVFILAIVWQAHSRESSWSFDSSDKGSASLESPNVSLDEHHANSSEHISRYTNSTMRTNNRRALRTTYKLVIVAIGDSHGDLKNTLLALKDAGVVNEQGKWTGKATYLIHTGDIIDRGPDTIKLYEYMDSLRVEAREAGGYVVSLMGNHEYLNLMPNWEFVSTEEFATFGNSIEVRWGAITNGPIGTAWRDRYRVASRLPYHPSLGPLNTDYVEGSTGPLSHAALSFVHGGLSPTYPELTPFPSRINELGISTLLKLQILGNTVLTDEEKTLLLADSPLLYRGWAVDKDEKVCAEVDAVLEKTGTRRMIMGHTAQLENKGILARCGGKIIVIDTGISSWYDRFGGRTAALRIQYTLAPRGEITSDPDQQVWVEREVITAIGHSSQVEIVNSQREITGDFEAFAPSPAPF